MSYRVLITPRAEAAILDQARHIAIDRHSPLNATRWLHNILDAADSLEQWPRRCALAPEDQYRPYEIRKINVGGHQLLFTIDDNTQTVWVISFRHGRMLPNAGDLPDDLDELADT